MKGESGDVKAGRLLAQDARGGRLETEGKPFSQCLQTLGGGVKANERLLSHGVPLSDAFCKVSLCSPS